MQRNNVGINTKPKLAEVLVLLEVATVVNYRISANSWKS
jgi:hypothetical protein